MEHEVSSINRTPTVGKVLEGIRDKIFQLEFKSGDSFTESSLADEYGVSRGSIRSALQKLESEGLISTRANGRKVIVGIDEKFIEGLYETRIHLERKAAEICITHQEINYTPLALALTKFYTLQSTPKESLALERSLANTGFHRALFETAGNNSLLRCWETLQPLFFALAKMNYVTLGEKNDDLRVIKQHTRILELVLKKDPGITEEIDSHIREAIDDSLKGYRDLLK